MEKKNQQFCAMALVAILCLTIPFFRRIKKTQGHF